MNRMKSFGLLLTGVLICLIVFSSTSALAQRGGGGPPMGGDSPPMMAMPPVPTGTLEVMCIGPSGAPEKDVNVTIIPISTTKGKGKKSNAAGKAVFDKQETGIYHVVGRKKGFAPAFYDYAVIDTGGASVDLKLEAGEDRKLYFEDKALENRAFELVDQGSKTLEAGNAAEAEKFFTESLAIRPSAPDALYYYGMALAEQGKYDQATESFKKAAEMAKFMLSTLPKPKPAWPGMGGPGGPGGAPKTGGVDGGAPKPGGTGGGGVPKPGGSMMGGEPSRAQIIYETIADNAEQQIIMIPLMKAEAAYADKRLDEAIALYDEAIKSYPNVPIFYANRALALTQVGRFDEANSSVNKALELSPGDERALQVKKAVEAFAENAAREKENVARKQANDLLNEGNKLLDSDASSALKKYEEANALTGGQQAVIWRQVGRAQAKLKQDTEAVAAFKKAIELSAGDQVENYQMSLAQYYLDAKRPDEALDVVVAGSKDPEQRLMDLYTRGKNNPDSMDFSTAALERVVKLNPSNFDAVFELGQVYYMDRKDSQAQELLNRYVENGKDTAKLQTANDLLTVIASRNKPK